MKQLVLKGKPLSTGSIYRYACVGRYPRLYMTHEGKAIKKTYSAQAQAQWDIPPVSAPIALEANFYFQTNGKKDLDNHLKLLLDSLIGIVYEDDSQIVQLTLTKQVDKNDPRIEVTVL